MSGSLIPNAKQQYLDANGNPLAGGFVYYYIPSTTTFKNTYQNAALTILNSNPIILDSAGECIAYGAGSYRQIVTDVNGNLIWDQPTLSLITNDATNVIYTPTFTGAVAETVAAKLSEWVSVKDFGAKGDGTTNDTSAIQAALNSGKTQIFVPEGTYIVSTIAIPSYVHLFGSGWNSIIQSNGSANHVLTTSNTYGVYISDLQVQGNVSRTNLSGIYLHGCAGVTLTNVYCLSNGQHGVYGVGNTDIIGVYPAWILQSQFQNNVLDGINLVAYNSSNQMNAISIIQTHCIQNGRNGATLWGTNISFNDSVVEGNAGYGVALTNYLTSGFQSASNINVNNNYFEKNTTSHIGITTTYGVITGLTIQNNYGYQDTTTIGAGYLSVGCTPTGENTIRQLNFSNNNFGASPIVPTVIADFGNALSYDCVVSPYMTYNSSFTDVSDVFTSYAKLGYAKFNCMRSTTPQGYFVAKGGSGITYSGLNKSDNITVSGSNIYYPLSIPLGASLLKMTMPVETDSTNYDVEMLVFQRSTGSTSTYTSYGITKSAQSGNQLIDTGSLLGATSQANLRLKNSNLDCLIRVKLTITTPGTYLYIGNPTLYYM